MDVESISSAFVRRSDGAYCFVLELGEEYAERPEIYGKWRPPAGRLKRNETPEHAAYRAAEEEAGLKVRLTGRCHTIPFTHRDNLTVNHYFPAELIEDRGAGDHPRRWFALDEITGGNVMNYVPGIMREMELINMRKKAVFVFPMQPDGSVLLHQDNNTHRPTFGKYIPPHCSTSLDSGYTSHELGWYALAAYGIAGCLRPNLLVREYENGERHYLIADVESHDPDKSKPFAPEQLKSEPVADWVQEIMGRMELI